MPNARQPRRIELLKSQKADLAKMLADRGISPLEFKWDYIDSASSTMLHLQVPRLQHSGAEYYFTFDRGISAEGELWVLRGRPGSEAYENERVTSKWTGVRELFGQWASTVRRELDAEDPWADSGEAFDGDWTTSNDAFTKTELEKLDGRLDEVRQYLIGQANQSQETFESIQSGIEDLKRSARTLGKKDWATLFVGWFFMHCADWAVSQTHWHHILTILLKSTKSFLLQM